MITWSRDHVINELSEFFVTLKPGTSTNTKYQVSGVKWQVSGVLARWGVTSGWAVALVWRWELRTENWELRTRDKPLDSIASGIGHHLDCVSCVAYQEIYLDIGGEERSSVVLIFLRWSPYCCGSGNMSPSPHTLHSTAPWPPRHCSSDLATQAAGADCSSVHFLVMNYFHTFITFISRSFLFLKKCHCRQVLLKAPSV